MSFCYTFPEKQGRWAFLSQRLLQHVTGWLLVSLLDSCGQALVQMLF